MSDTVHTVVGVVARSAIPLLMFTLGLGARHFELGYLLKRPGLLARSLLATLVLAPLLLVGFARLLPLDLSVKAGLVVLAIAPGAPLAPGRSLKFGGNDSYTYSLFLALGLLSLVTAPLSLWVLGRISGHDWAIAPSALLPTILLHQTLPVLLGLGLRRLAPKLADTAFPAMRVVANTCLALLIALVLVTRGRSLLSLDWLVLTVLFLVLAGLVLLAGHLCGGPRRESRRTLAVLNALRHPGLAFLIAQANFPRSNVVPTILSYLIAASLASFLYDRLAPHGARGAEPEAPLRLDDVTASRA